MKRKRLILCDEEQGLALLYKWLCENQKDGGWPKPETKDCRAAESKSAAVPFKRVTVQQQLWEELRSDEQRQVMASHLRHIKHGSQGELCLALVTYLRFGIVRTLDKPWLNRYLQSLIDYLKVEKELGHFPSRKREEPDRLANSTLGGEQKGGSAL